MAYDKVVDSTQLETAIKATADAIREKTGDTALLEWVASKGFADVVAGIETGGGVKITSGTITPANETTEISITHGLGELPTTVLMFVDPLYNVNNNYVVFAGYVSEHSFLSYGPNSSYKQYKFCKYATSSGVKFSADDNVVSAIDENNITFTRGEVYSVKYHAKKTVWLAIGGETA